MKLNVKVIAAVLGLVTMATMLVACTRDVVKEVEVPSGSSLETVVKEVPVQRVVVEREVVREVEVPGRKWWSRRRWCEEVEVPVEIVVEKVVVRKR